MIPLRSSPAFWRETKVLLDIGSLQEGMEAEAMPADGASSEGAASDTTGEDA